LAIVVKEDGRLIVLTDGTQTNSSAEVESRWEFVGDFDIQVDFQIGDGWNRPAKGHIEGATFWVMSTGQRYHMTRLRRDKGRGEDLFFAWIGNTSINASHAFTTYFDNFCVNSGLTT